MSYAERLCEAPAAGSGCELADVLLRYGDRYVQTHRVSPSQRKVAQAIVRCRTAALGGQRQWCQVCGYEGYTYHSCRNRHCPKCQTMKSAQWAEARRRELLPVPYFHNVFTLPHDVNPLILYSQRNQRALLKLLLDAVAQTLAEFGRGELGGTIGFTLVLHTWDQRLKAHFHVHCLIASGALADDSSRWIAGGSHFLFPVRGLSKRFRRHYLHGVQALFERDQLDLPPQLAALSEAAPRRRWLRRCRKKDWVVYSKQPFSGPRKLVDYLSRYTHRVAISNHRLLSCEDGQVRFAYRDRRDGDRVKTETLSADEFLQRFLQHVLPDRFCRIRHYGLLANGVKKKRLARCRELLGARQPPSADELPQTAAEWMEFLLGVDLNRCPCCGAELYTAELSPQVPAPEDACQPIPFRNYPPWHDP